jgi:hypothetical protein
MSRHLIVKPLATPVDKLGPSYIPCIDVCAIDRLDTTVVDEGIVRNTRNSSASDINLVHGAKKLT